MRIWVYAAKQAEASAIAAGVLGAQDRLVGVSISAGEDAVFPNGGLTPAMQAAVGGQLDLLVVSPAVLSAPRSMGLEAMEALFSPYRVSVRSCSSSGRSSS